MTSSGILPARFLIKRTYLRSFRLRTRVDFVLGLPIRERATHIGRVFESAMIFMNQRACGMISKRSDGYEFLVSRS